MRLSVKSEYACLALIDLSAQPDQELVRIEDIATRRDIPRKYLEQIMLLLKRGGFLKSKRGIGGGYVLSKPPGQIRVADVIRLMDGPLAPVNSVSEYFYEHTPIENSPKLVALFQDIRDYTAHKLENTTFADLV